MRHHQEAADQHEMQLQLALFRMFASNQAEVKQGQRQQEEHTAQIEAYRYYVHPCMPLAIYGERDKRGRE
ncbi:hypothetical protein D3C75_1338800 [compost metagenome]